jgi:hypothetical protein
MLNLEEIKKEDITCFEHYLLFTKSREWFCVIKNSEEDSFVDLVNADWADGFTFTDENTLHFTLDDVQNIFELPYNFGE